MNENYSGVSSGALPEGYGDTPTEGVVPATQELPSPEDGSGQYEGIRDWFTRSGASEEEEEEEEEDAEEEERSSFWSNLASSFSGSSDSGPERLPATGTTAAGFAYHRNPDGTIEVIEGSNAGATYSASGTTATNLKAAFGPYPSAQGSRASEGSEVVSAEEAAEEAAVRGSALGAGIGGFVQSALPTFMEMFGPQIEEQPLVTGEDLPEVQQAGFPWVPIVAIAAVGGVGFIIYKQVKKK